MSYTYTLEPRGGVRKSFQLLTQNIHFPNFFILSLAVPCYSITQYTMVTCFICPWGPYPLVIPPPKYWVKNCLLSLSIVLLHWSLVPEISRLKKYVTWDFEQPLPHPLKKKIYYEGFLQKCYKQCENCLSFLYKVFKNLEILVFRQGVFSNS